jgi:hypothetical protein
MSTDVYAIGTALASAYGAVTISDSTVVGGTAIRGSAFLTPNNAPTTPYIYIELPSGEAEVEATGDQRDVHTFDVYFLLAKASGDLARDKAALAKWIGPLRAALFGTNQLGVANVLKARPTEWEFGLYEYGGDQYHAWHLTVKVWVTTSDSITP